jgi:hypothetical protein
VNVLIPVLSVVLIVFPLVVLLVSVVIGDKVTMGNVDWTVDVSDEEVVVLELVEVSVLELVMDVSVEELDEEVSVFELVVDVSVEEVDEEISVFELVVDVSVEEVDEEVSVFELVVDVSVVDELIEVLHVVDVTVNVSVYVVDHVCVLVQF